MSNGVVGRLVALLVVVTTMVAANNSTRVCSRWNCPCSGTVNKRTDASKRWYDNYHIDAEIARRRTKHIIDRMKTERFHDEDHMALLRDCSDRRNPVCTQSHFENDCTMEGLPTLPLIDQFGAADFSSHPQGRVAIASQSRNLLGRLAVFVDQARRDEERHVSSSEQSLADDIRLLEEQHLYHILCNLHVDFTSKDIDWNANISRDLMQLGCRLLNNQAPIDNRNYMIFYTLEKLLHKISSQFQRVVRRGGINSNSEILRALG